jgi:sphingomyelin phosphodiesterase
VAHISDVHIDRNYTVGAEANCTKPICCRPDSSTSSNRSETAGPFGDPNCDTPPSLSELLIDQISKNNKFTIFTGDVVEGMSWFARSLLFT